MGWIRQSSWRIGDGPTSSVTRVIEEPGEYEWVTLANKNGTPVVDYQHKPFRIARPGHKKHGHRFTVYATRQAAGRGEVQ